MGLEGYLSSVEFFGESKEESSQKLIVPPHVTANKLL
jgi:hypothetical protein